MEDLFGYDTENNISSTNDDQSFSLDEAEILPNHVEIPSSSTVQDEIEVSSHEIPSTNNFENGPQTGALYPDIESLFRSYLEHSRYRGFGIIKRTTGKTSGEYKYLLMTCDKARKTATQKTTKRVGCPARVNAIKQIDGSWMVSTVVAKHNHELTPHMSILMPAHRSISTNMKRQLEANDIAGIRPCKSVRLAEVQCGGPMNLGCLSKDCRNFVEGRRRLRLGSGDAEAIRKLFWGLQKRDRSFVYSLGIDDQGRLSNMLWIHPRCRAAYAEFNDVLTFDTTYLVNKYKMPFATVVGINHHGQSILLGCALVTHEDAESFKWFFRHWLDAMDDVHPKCIITDQCESIKIAIRDLMPNTIHRYCLWHIMSKVPQKFKGVVEYNKAVIDFKRIVYDSITTETFELKWGDFLQKYALEDNEWLLGLFNEKESWVPCYLNHIFWAGMLSTQRSEGMHAFFDGYIHSRSTLKQFVEQYELAMTNKIQKEFMAEHDTKNKLIRCISQFPWERQFRSSYTNNIFKKFQEEISRMLYCHIVDEQYDQANDIEKILVHEKSTVNEFYTRDFTFTVDYTAVGEYFSCNCKKFEFMGVLCCHILVVLSKKGIQSVNERYLLRRWRKDVYRRHSSIFFAGGYPHMTEEYKKFQGVEQVFQECVDGSISSTQKMDLLKQRMYEIKDELLQFDQSAVGEITGATVRTNGDDSFGGTPILNPEVTRPRGRPRQNRFVSANETNRGRRTTRGRSNSGRGRCNSRRGRDNLGQGNNPPIPTNSSRHNFEFDLNDPVVGTQGSVS